MKRIFSSLLLLLVAIMGWAQAKYVFYFIGDGMGINQVVASETYLAALEGRIGVEPMCFPSFPYTGMAITNSATNGVTDSAAGGTALSTGHKTKNGRIGMAVDGTTRLSTVAEWARDCGKAVGIATSVSVDHATPAVFFGHQPDRNMYYEIGQDLIAAKFDFHAGSDFLKPKKDGVDKDLYQQCTEAGYTIAKGYKEYQKKMKKADRMILLQSDEANKRDRSALPYAIDRKKTDLTLADITRAGINFLTKKDKGEGFFFMIEGGKIDWACHANDALTTLKEVMDMDEAVKVAYEFYQQHPDETLIVITADHETGGLAMGTGKYELHLDRMAGQTVSSGNYTAEVTRMRTEYGKNFTWDVLKQSLTEHFGLWARIKMDERQEQQIRRAYDALIAGIDAGSESLYQKEDGISNAAKRIVSEAAMIGWASGSHSNAPVGVYAIGAGAELFTGLMDNTDVPKKIAKAANYPSPFDK